MSEPIQTGSIPDVVDVGAITANHLQSHYGDVAAKHHAMVQRVARAEGWQAQDMPSKVSELMLALTAGDKRSADGRFAVTTPPAKAPIAKSDTGAPVGGTTAQGGPLSILYMSEEDVSRLTPQQIHEGLLQSNSGSRMFNPYQNARRSHDAKKGV